MAVKERVLGIDYGKTRIGLAISDDLGLLAHPLATIAAGPGAISRIAEIVRQRDIQAVVVGLPKLMSGLPGRAAEEVEHFIVKLRGKVECAVVPWDERLTTLAAQRALHEAGKSTRASRSYIDQVAAQMILQGFLDRQSQPATEQLRQSE